MTERERKPRRRKRSYDEEESDGISGWKLGAVIGVVVVCFATLYPSVFHPMLMGLIGGRQPQPQTQQNRPPVHPGMGGASRGGPHGRSHEHPAMRMAAAQAEAQTTSGNKGMFTWMVPIYMVGFIVFLLYTLFKPKKKRNRRSRYDSDLSSDDEGDAQQFQGKIGRKKLHTLQERLRQTEEAMAKILEQLEVVQTAQKSEMAEGNEDEEENEEGEGGSGGDGTAPFIGDLENALKQFKDISEEYEKEKDLHFEDIETGSEEENEDEEEDEEIDEEEDEEEAERAREEELRRKEKELEELRKKQREEEEAKKTKKVRRRAKRV